MSFSESDIHETNSLRKRLYKDNGIFANEEAETRICHKISETSLIKTFDYDDEEDSLTETCSSLSTTPEYYRKCPTAYENDDSDCNDYDTDDSFQEFNLKLAKTLIGKHETLENESKLLGKYDELQDFFYFFAVEYFTGNQNEAELVSAKRKEFVTMWQDIIGPCDVIFDQLVDCIGDINAENSFRLRFKI